MPELSEWYLTMFDKPMFQFFQGVLIGMVIAYGLWLLHKGLHKDVQKGEEDGQEQGD